MPITIIKLIIKPLIISTTISYLSTPIVIKFANHFKLTTDSKNKTHPAHTHTGIIPRAGGLASYISLLTSSLLLIPLDQHLKGILLGATIIIVTGLLDDKYNLSPYLRFIINFLAAGCIIASGIGIAFISNPFNHGIIKLDQPQINFFIFNQKRSIWLLSDTFALIWIVWCMNMVNWSKGLDGQMPGFVAISALIISVFSLKFSADITQWETAILASITAGAYLGFLPFNYYPQKIMPGYGGGSLAGFMLAVLSILSTTKVGTLTLVLGVPLADGCYTILRRILKKQSPFRGDRGHLHHLLLDLGLSKQKIALIYWIFSAILGTLAIRLNSTQKLYAITTIFLIIGAFLIWGNLFITYSKQPGQDNG